jgi:uncharacterized RDD family membrane protein YckC
MRKGDFVYCSKCGSEISPTTAFCSTCGQSISVLAPASVPSLSPVDPNQYAPVAAATVSYSGVAYAGFWLRFVAFIIDGVVSGVLFVVLLIPLSLLTGVGPALSRITSGEDFSDEAGAFLAFGFIMGLLSITFGVRWLYYALSESSSWQATLGKKMLNLTVTDMDGQPISFARASGRYFSKFITNLIPLAIGYILAGFTEKRQAIHDMIASCLVLRKI